MPKFYLHIRTAFLLHLDAEGADYESSNLARQAAIASVQDALSECIARGRTIDGRSFEIADEHGTIVEVVSFNEALRSA